MLLDRPTFGFDRQTVPRRAATPVPPGVRVSRKRRWTTHTSPDRFRESPGCVSIVKLPPRQAPPWRRTASQPLATSCGDGGACTVQRRMDTCPLAKPAASACLRLNIAAAPVARAPTRSSDAVSRRPRRALVSKTRGTCEPAASQTVAEGDEVVSILGLLQVRPALFAYVPSRLSHRVVVWFGLVSIFRPFQSARPALFMGRPRPGRFRTPRARFPETMAAAGVGGDECILTGKCAFPVDGDMEARSSLETNHSSRFDYHRCYHCYRCCRCLTIPFPVAADWKRPGAQIALLVRNTSLGMYVTPETAMSFHRRSHRTIGKPREHQSDSRAMLHRIYFHAGATARLCAAAVTKRLRRYVFSRTRSWNQDSVTLWSVILNPGRLIHPTMADALPSSSLDNACISSLRSPRPPQFILPRLRPTSINSTHRQKGAHATGQKNAKEKVGKRGFRN